MLPNGILQGGAELVAVRRHEVARRARERAAEPRLRLALGVHDQRRQPASVRLQVLSKRTFLKASKHHGVPPVYFSGECIGVSTH